MSMNPIVSPVHSARNPLPDNCIDDLPRGQHVVRVEDMDGVNVIFMPPIACVMRDPDGQDRPVRITDSDDLIARVFAGWSMVDCAEPGAWAKGGAT